MEFKGEVEFTKACALDVPSLVNLEDAYIPCLLSKVQLLRKRWGKEFGRE